MAPARGPGSTLERPLLGVEPLPERRHRVARWVFGTLLRSRGRAIRVCAAAYGLALASLMVLQHALAWRASWAFGFVGGIVGALSSGIVLGIFGLVPASRRHPNTLLAMRALADLLVGLRFVFSGIINSEACPEAGGLACTARDVGAAVGEPRPSCAPASVLMTFAELSSEMWFVAVSLDLFLSLRNPLTNYASNVRRYQLAAWGVGLLAALVMWSQPQAIGLWAIGDTYLDDVALYCWFRYDNSWSWNWSWTLFYAPLVGAYLVAATCMVLGYYRLQVGLPSTLQNRLDVLVRSFANLLIYSFYWLVLGLVFFATTSLVTWHNGSEGMRQATTALYEVLLFLLASKGWADLVVWITANDPREILRLHAKLKGAGGAGAQAAAADSDLRPQVNEALLAEMMFLMASGIRTSMATLSARQEHRDSEISRRSSLEPSAGPLEALSTRLDMPPSEGVFAPIPWPEGGAANGGGTIGLMQFFRLVLDNPRARDHLDRIHSRRRSPRSAAAGSGDASCCDSAAPSDALSASDLARKSFREGGLTQASDSQASLSDEMLSDPESGLGNSSPRHSFDTDLANRPTEPARGGASTPEAPRPDLDMGGASGATEKGAEAGGVSLLELQPEGEPRATGVLGRLFGTLVENKVAFYQFKPTTFGRVRRCFGISNASFAESFQRTAKERLTEGGASGAFFFYSGNLRYMAKSVTAKEKAFLLRIADDYATYVCQNPRTFLTRIYALFQIRIYQREWSFFVMENLFNTSMSPEMSIDQRYDLKGSWVKRNYTKPRPGQKVICRYCNREYAFVDEESQAAVLDDRVCLESRAAGGRHAPNVTLKDNDLNFKLRLSREEEERVRAQLSRDSVFLRGKGIMDYSLLLGVHEREYFLDAPPVPLSGFALTTDPYGGILGSGVHGSSPGNAGLPAEGAGPATSEVPQRLSLRNSAPRLPRTDESGSPSLRPSESRDTEPGREEKHSEPWSDENPPTPGATAQLPSPEMPARRGISAPVFRGAASLTSQAPSAGEDGAGMGLGATDGRNLAKDMGLQQIDMCRLPAARVVGPAFYFVGIIDILQQWDLQKKGERFVKCQIRGQDPRGVSALEPSAYQKRFMRRMELTFSSGVGEERPSEAP